jgi:hypothetical protein
MSVRRVRVSGRFLSSFLRDSELRESSLPGDVNVIGIAGEDRDSFVLLVESSEFPPVGEGQLIPFIEPVFARKGSRRLKQSLRAPGGG